MILLASALAETPWRNGGGSRWAIVERPEDGWELAFARIDRDGPFSDYTGHDRTIMLLEGDGFVLDVRGRSTMRVERPLTPARFDGGLPTQCKLLGGPCQVLNLIALRDRPRPFLTVKGFPTDLDRALAAVVLGGTARVGDAALSWRDTVVFPHEGALAGRATVAVLNPAS